MSFTTPILFTPENEVQRKEFIYWVENVGYVNSSPIHHLDDVICAIDGKYFSMDTPHMKGDVNYYKFYDCNSNLKLAKALSALRDDSDYMQWFISEWDKEWYLYNNDNSTFIDSQSDMRKATPRELIERFKI